MAAMRKLAILIIGVACLMEQHGCCFGAVVAEEKTILSPVVSPKNIPIINGAIKINRNIGGQRYAFDRGGVGIRTAPRYHAKAFMDDLASRVTMRVQISSDALAAYSDAIERSFGTEADYGQIVKTYSVTPLGKAAAVRYSPAEVVKTEKTIVSGMPDISRISTSHVEKQNHTLRMHCRRLTRLMNAFSKKIENFEAAVALNFAYYNFCKTHGALKMTPAMAAGVASTFWTVEDLVKLSE